MDSSSIRWVFAGVLLFAGVFFIQFCRAKGITDRQEVQSLQDGGNQPVYGGTYRRALAAEPATLDPAINIGTYGGVVVRQIVEGLVQYSDDHMVIPCLAEHWESSRNNLQWVFYLKKGVRFHNGRELTAEDFVYSFTRLLHPKTDTWVATQLLKVEGASEYREGKADSVEGLKAIDRYTLQIRLSEPFSSFIFVLSMTNFSVVPQEELERSEKDFALHPVGTGPFRFVHWKPNEAIELRANEDYHEGKPYLDRLIFKIFPTSSRQKMLAEFEKGKLEDSLFPEEERSRLLTQVPYQVLSRSSKSIRFLVMNNSMEPFNDKRVRQALNYAIDKEALSAQVGKGGLAPATTLIPPGMAGYNPNKSNYPYSPKKAQELLTEAGFPDGKGLPVIQIWSFDQSKLALAENKAIAQYFEKIGVKGDFHYLDDWPKFLKMVLEGEIPAFKVNWSPDIPDPDNVIHSLFYSQSSSNVAFYHNPEVDELIKRAQMETDYNRRISLYSTIQRKVMEDSPVVLLSYRAYERVFQPYVRNFKENMLGDHSFSLKRVWFDTKAMH